MSDLDVERLSAALAGRQIDFVVSGSIGAVESVRCIRALRRLGAEITPWLTAGGANFTTPTALAWAAGRPVRSEFSGDASHIAVGEACIVAPASASLIGKVVAGITDSPATALVTSYLGQKRPVLLLPNMHDSLAAAPTVARNLATLPTLGIQVLEPRRAEGKRKFPEPETLADEIAHLLNAGALYTQGHKASAQPVLVTMGSTRGYIDDVRYVSNYSSGALGSAIAEELYRLGYATTIICGASQIRPRVYSVLKEADTNDTMELAIAEALSNGARAAVLAASVLDFAPVSKAAGKIASASHEHLLIDLARTRKLIAGVRPVTGVKVGFKLETGLTIAKARTLADSYMDTYGLSLMVVNDLADVDAQRHHATVFETPAASRPSTTKYAKNEQQVDGKGALALLVAAHVHARLRLAPPQAQ